MRDMPKRARLLHGIVAIALLFSLLGMPLTSQPALADHTPTPTSVALVGSLQSEVGCPGDWQPECVTSELTYDATDMVWQGAFSVPAGNWEYKAALNDSWDENYGANAQPGGNNIALTLPNTTTVKFYYDHKSHWITSNQSAVIAVAPGSFQSELGCPGDWQPDCLRSWLQDTDGDGIYTFITTAIAAGSYEGKVALNESWDVNYGAGGEQNGPNIPFTVANNGDTVTFSYNATSHVPTITVTGQPTDDLAALVKAPVRHPIQEAVFYFVMPDRFQNGSTANDQGGLTGDRLVTGFDPTDKGFYHGGDLAGLLSKMDYLDQMGVTAIWMTPMFKNRPVQGSGADISAGYYGYWITDFTQMDPHFGTNTELQQVITEVHNRGIKIFFDIITNHTADVIQYQENQYSYRNKTDFPYKDASGATFDDRAYAGGDTFPTLNAATSFPYTPVFPNAGDATVKVPAWLNDPTYYHNRGNSTFTGENSLYGDFFGLDDLFTEQPAVVNGMLDIYKGWITNFGIDGFRIDTMKHVNAEFWQKFAPAILDHAKTAGKPDFFIFGEVFSGNVNLLSYYTTDADVQAVLDFQFQEGVQAYVSKGGASDGLKTVFENDDYYIDADSNAYALPTFIGNHDRGRFGWFLKTDQPTAGDAELLARSKLAHALMYFARGMPVVYYGDEQGFTGDGGDKDARQDMMPSQVASYNDDDLIGTTATTADANFDQSHPLYLAFQSYAKLRKAHPALVNGAQIHRTSSNAAGIYAFSRMERTERVEYVVAINNANSAQSATVPTFYAAGTQFDLLLAEGTVAASLTTDANGALAINLPALGFAIYKAAGPLPASTAAPTISISNLTNNQEVTLGTQNLDGNTVPDRLEIRAAVAGTGYAEVTFAVRATGTTTYTVIGVDDNAPYRVFYDASKLPANTTLDILAIANDLNGNLKGATVTGVKPVKAIPPTTGQYKYAVIHYQRPTSDYGDHTTGNSNDFWGLHLWGEAIDASEVTEWTTPKPFLGEDSYGRFAWIKLQDSSKDVNFIVHKGDVKDGTDADRKFNPNSNSPEIWLKQGDPTFYTTQAAAQGFVTIHYKRADNSYTGWGLHLWGDGLGAGVPTEWATPRPYDGVDDFGAYWNVPISDASKVVNFIIHKGDEKDPGPDQSMNPIDGADAWVVSGDATVYKQRGATEKYAIIHYHRPAGDYGDATSSNYADFWGMHTWTGAAAPNPSWQEPVKPAGQDGFGIWFKVPLTADATELAYILHKGDEKDPGPDQFLKLGKFGYEVWQLQGAEAEDDYLLPIRKGAVAGGDLSKAQAHWVSQDTIAWDIQASPNATYTLVYAADGGLVLTANGITGGSALNLTYDPAGLSDAIKAKFPHLANYKAFKLSAGDLAAVPAILKGQTAIAAMSGGVVVDATSLQIPGVLDALYTYDGALGVNYTGDVPTLSLWAPTAKSVKLHLFDSATAATATQIIDMTAGDKGVWHATGDASWTGKYYLYEVAVYVRKTGKVEQNIVTDPYSLALSTNSKRSLLVNLNDPALKPAGWDSHNVPPSTAPENAVLYELHVRDFSIQDSTVPEGDRGTFNAFTHTGSNGMKHLSALAAAGLTHVHLLPAFDCATINENKAARIEPTIPNAAPDSDQQQAAVTAVADQDGFNWCYDPYHYTVPEGSYATNPAGVTRIIEFRKMVQALHAANLRVVMDVVYNHTAASGQDAKSVLDKVVPGYYHRLNADGNVETSTCCQNTATEHAMMEKLMIDSLVTWTSLYGVDGFRFDLMGHHMKSNMEKVRDTLRAIDPSIVIYGEGWNFGEVANNARGVNATQLNLAGTGIGTFSDRLRDAVRGGGPFDNGNDLIKNQGFISGLYYDPNSANSGSAAEKNELLLSADQIRVGLAGNLADFEFIDRNGNLVKGSQVDYNGAPAGYTQDPQEHIIYVEAHDNQTLWDISAYKHAAGVSMADRVRAHNLGIDFTVLAQGVPFLHAGQELLRSKSLDRNSYNSGDWFNKLDFTYQSNNWGVGLPPQGDNGSNWPIMQPLLANPALKPGSAEIQLSLAHLQTMLQVRHSSPLFRLQTEADVMARLAFHNMGPDQIPGLIVMSLSDMVDGLVDLDPAHEFIVVLFNATDEAQSFTAAALQGKPLTLHPALAQSADSVVKGATFDSSNGAFTIPARTTAIFVDGVVLPTTITIALEAQPQTRRNFRFDGDLGQFKLDNPTTDDGDRYQHSATFTVEPGRYTVAAELPASWSLTAIRCNNGNSSVDLAEEKVTIAVTTGEQVTCTFTNQQRSALRVRKYHDENGNGQRNSGEERLEGWEFTLYDATGATVANDKSDEEGTVRFYRLPPGSYTVCEQLRAGWFNSQPGTVLPTFGNQPCYQLTIAPAQKWTAWFGNHQNADLAHSATVDALTVANGVDTATIVDDSDDEGYTVDVAAVDEELLKQWLYLPVVVK
ncbi:MAG: pullulanase-type alpha-1,6-glucosidase [Caldilinea sp. CFX5]|nr:pullulanase-type alpha-1,6-glucosidase [Caldilinea sp. CFX5]